MNLKVTRLHKFIRFAGICFVLLATILSAMVITVPSIANDDFIIVLDQSGSMREKEPGDPKGGYEKDPLQADKSRGAIDALNSIANDMLKEGDYFTLITFGDASDVTFSQELNYEHERDLFNRKIETLQFKDQRTDILAGIKKATDLLVSMDTPQRRKILVMITDGINEPPDDSPYKTPEAQKRVYEELRETIRKHNWDIALVGLGEYTDIADIAQKLNLPTSNAIIMDEFQDSRDIMGKLRDIVGDMQEARVEMEAKELKLRLKPKLLGGYEIGQETLSLTSFYNKEVDIQLNPQIPLQIEGSDTLQVTVSPLQLTLAPQQSAALSLTFTFNGKRPDEGRVSGNFTFQFTDTSRQFFPHDGKFEVLLPSWWEVYGLLAAAAIVFVLLVLGFIIWAIRRAQVPEVRIIVTADESPLGSPMTLRRNETFSIANGDFSSNVVPAKGLSCKTAATVKYLGRRKFEIKAAEAKILVEGKELDHLQIGMEKYFDLEDSDGKKLRSVMITKPGKGGDIFGGSGGGDDIF